MSDSEYTTYQNKPSHQKIFSIKGCQTSVYPS